MIDTKTRKEIIKFLQGFRCVSDKYFVHRSDGMLDLNKDKSFMISITDYEFLDLFYYVDKEGRCVVSEGITGMRVKTVYNEDIYTVMKVFLDEHCHKLIAVMRKGIKKYGITPRYVKVKRGDRNGKSSQRKRKQIWFYF